MYKLSVIIPVKNNVDKALHNIDGSCISSVEYLLVGTGGDNFRFPSNVKYIEKESNIYEAMNVGLDNCRGAYVYFKGSTDKVNINSVLDSLDGTEVIIGAVRLHNKILRFTYQPGRINYVHHQAFVAKRDGARFKLRYKIYSDLDFMNRRLASSNGDIKITRRVFGEFIKGGTSSNRSNFLVKCFELSIISQNFDKYFFLRKGFILNILRLLWYRVFS